MGSFFLPQINTCDILGKENKSKIDKLILSHVNMSQILNKVFGEGTKFIKNVGHS